MLVQHNEYMGNSHLCSDVQLLEIKNYYIIILRFHFWGSKNVYLASIGLIRICVQHWKNYQARRIGLMGQMSSNWVFCFWQWQYEMLFWESTWACSHTVVHLPSKFVYKEWRDTSLLSPAITVLWIWCSWIYLIYFEPAKTVPSYNFPWPRFRILISQCIKK